MNSHNNLQESSRPSSPPPKIPPVAGPPATANFHPVSGICVGFSAALFASMALWDPIVHFVPPLNVGGSPVRLGGLLVMLAWIFVAALAGFAAYSRHTSIRLVSWGSAGLGVGIMIEAVIAGGLRLGHWLTLSGVVLAAVFAFIGYRQGLKPTPT